MKLPRNASFQDLVRGHGKLGHVTIRQRGSHIKMAIPTNPAAKLTIPAHRPIKVGTLSAILADVSAQTGTPMDELLEKLEL